MHSQVGEALLYRMVSDPSYLALGTSLFFQEEFFCKIQFSSANAKIILHSESAKEKVINISMCQDL